MKQTTHSEEMIEDLVNLHCGESANARTRHVYREALRSLVRLAKAEQMFEMKSDIRMLIHAPTDTMLH
jgi:hypothetical protein